MRSRSSSFVYREDGAFAVFSLFVFLAMLLVAGLAVDMMRHENARVRLQGVTDRAVLAATMLGNNNGYATPEQLLQSYFTAAGLSEQLGSNYVIENNSLTGLNVTAQPEATMPTMLMSMIEIDQFPVITAATAQEAAQSAWLDVVMVLDISGSMGFDGGSRIISLRQAGSQLATQLLSNNQDGRVSLTLVPYDTSVYPPPEMLPFFGNLQGTVGDCPDFSNWSNIWNLNPHMFLTECHTHSWGMISPYMGNAAQASAAINALQPRDVTSIDLGMRYAAVMLNPDMRPAIDELIDLGMVSNDFDGRPFDWSEENVVRAVILLTDGENCCGHRGSQYQQNADTLNVCSALKDQDVLIYTIAFEAPPNGQSLMLACASSPAHYFDPTVGGLLNVFASIGSNVVTQTLRLTE